VLFLALPFGFMVAFEKLTSLTFMTRLRKSGSVSSRSSILLTLCLLTYIPSVQYSSLKDTEWQRSFLFVHTSELQPHSFSRFEAPHCFLAE
jgi:hypothetical protein